MLPYTGTLKFRKGSPCVSRSQEPGDDLRELGQESTDILQKASWCPAPGVLWPAQPHSSRLSSAPVTKCHILTVSTGVEGDLRAGRVAPPLAVGQKDVSCPPRLGSRARCLRTWQERRECASRWLLLGMDWGAMRVAEG